MEFLRQEVLNRRDRDRQTDRDTEKQRQRETETQRREVDRQTEGRKIKNSCVDRHLC